MSRNFELLKQIEIEVDVKGHSAPLSPVRPVETAAVSPTDVSSEEMVRLVQSIFLPANGRAPRQVVFCGVDDEKGSSSVCASAGRALAAGNAKSVCLVDANVRMPRLSGLSSGNAAIPFTGKSASLREQCVRIGGNLWILGAHLLTDEHGALLSVDALKHVLEQLGSLFEYVLIDAPGTSVSGDAAVLGQLADACILVIEANSTRRMTARKAKETLDAAGVRLLGTILNNRTFAIPEAIYRKI